ncbi:MAG: Hsp20/alpha crystallin family protein [Richelia sp. RM2_1_2]|nr:Hsp20/alpha crystallin family protein [Richelia sp. SM2_1_7]NJO65705.1 Hsp20/alpha crystallin family protein [Richelia sp. RM2_1_2]
MALIRWRPFQEMEIISRQIDRMFDEMLDFNRSLAKYKRENWTPPIELKDTREDLILRSELPGLDAKNLEVQVARQAVLISGEITDEPNTDESGYYRSELHYGRFRRMINLPVPIKNEQVKAEFKNGILKLVMPKTEEAKFKKVNIDVVEEGNKLPGTNSNKILDVPAEEA